MGYACPVCGDPQQDAGHLANHLAFTALLGDDEHEAWLDDHAPDWAEAGESELAGRVVDHAEEREFPQVFEDTATDPPDREAGPEGAGGIDPPADEATREVLAEARELTEAMQASAEDGPGDTGEDEGDP